MLVESQERTEKIHMKKSKPILLVTLCLALAACAPSGQSPVNVHVESPSPTSTPSISANTKPSPSASPVVSSDMKEAEFNGYPYSYKREGDTTIAMFVKRFLPRDDTIVVGAIRDVIRRAYKEEASGAPHLVDTTTTGGTAVRAIRVDGTKNGYVVIPVKEDTGEIHSLTITQVAR